VVREPRYRNWYEDERMDEIGPDHRATPVEPVGDQGAVEADTSAGMLSANRTARTPSGPAVTSATT
jgi:hypothetical protein